jgi:hypothetical protein
MPEVINSLPTHESYRQITPHLMDTNLRDVDRDDSKVLPPTLAAVGEIVIIRQYPDVVLQARLTSLHSPMVALIALHFPPVITGFPLWDCVMSDICQPSFNWFPLKGSSYKPADYESMTASSPEDHVARRL